MSDRCGPEKWHGTDGGYNNHKCRGDECRAAHAKAQRERHRKARLTGTLNGRNVGEDNNIRAAAAEALIKAHRLEYLALCRKLRAAARRKAAA